MARLHGATHFATAVVTAILLLALAPCGPIHASPDPYSAVENRIERLRQSESASVTEIGRSLKGRPIYGIVFTRVRGTAAEFGDAARILIISGQHGNEPMPIRASLSLMEKLAAGKSGLPESVLKDVVLVFVPVANPDGYAAGRRCNAAGVDLNRNWQTADQPETQAVSQLVKKLRPDAFIDQHEWDSSDPHRPNCIEVANFGSAAHFRLERILAAIGSHSSPLLSASSYSKRCNPTLAHRHFGNLGICSMLVETAPDWPDKERLRAYHALVISTATAVVSNDQRITTELAAIRRGAPKDNQWLAATCRVAPPIVAQTDQAPGWSAICLACIGVALALASRCGNRGRRCEINWSSLQVSRASRSFTISDLVQSDLPASEKLAMIQRYRLRPTDRSGGRGQGSGEASVALPCAPLIRPSGYSGIRPL